MINEKITVRITETGKTMDVVVFSKRAEAIEVVIGEGMNNMKCVLTPTRNGFAYDLGLFFDFTLLPLIDLGVHAAYNQLTAGSDDPAYHWLTFGAHAALIL